MSHFTTFVISKTDNREELERLMLPYHEYECTGITEYCIHQDITDETVTDYDKNKEDYESVEDFLDSWHGITNVYESEPETKPEDSYAVVKDGQIIKAYRFTNPNSKWDYYGSYDWERSEYVNIDRETDVIKKSQFDIDTFMLKRKEYYTELYNKLKPYFTSDFITWEQARKENENLDTARDVYNNQQSMKDMNEKLGSGEVFHLRWNINIDDVATKTLDEFVKANLDTVAPFWAMVTPDGKWIEKGKMGWWAISWDEDNNFNKTWTEVWKEIPDDCYIWKCDCHI